MKLHRSHTPSAVLAISVLAVWIAVSLCGTALAEDPDGNSDPRPSSTAAASRQPVRDPGFSNRDGDTDTKRQQELEARYGHDRDISTPPLIVKQSTGSSQFVTKPIHIEHVVPTSGVRESEKLELPRVSGARPIRLATGPAVVAGLQPANFESPAAQFMNFTYVFMAILLLILVAVAVGLSVRKDRLE